MQISDYDPEPFITNMDKSARPSSPLKIYAVKTKQSPKGNCFILMVQIIIQDLQNFLFKQAATFTFFRINFPISTTFEVVDFFIRFS